MNAGGNFIDTARMYFDSEERIGNTLDRMGNRADVVIASKTAQGNSLENISLMRSDMEESLRKLKTDFIDIYQIHHPSRPQRHRGFPGGNGAIQNRGENSGYRSVDQRSECNSGHSRSLSPIHRYGENRRSTAHLQHISAKQ
ncbi:MAG TPA: hypothetical protein DIV79_15785 [Opitutae bacterium]|nr:hypothetical protein [Opitutaceae bacterium]HCR31466.1 hypothetical protein [Opitutae bacterium]